jgi:hypothetical protein
MTGAGFHVQLFARTPSSEVGWRLLSGNHREAGRTAPAYPDAEACRIAIKELQRDLPYLEQRLRRVEPNRWMWELRTARGLVVATSGRAFDRLIRCEQAGAQFVEQFVDAPVAPAVVYTSTRRWGSVAS